MRRNNFNCKKYNYNFSPNLENIDNFEKMPNIPNMTNMTCNKPVRKHLEPVLVARIYNQPIIEEIPYSAMSMTLDNTTSVSNVCSDVKPICDDFDCGCQY